MNKKFSNNFISTLEVLTNTMTCTFLYNLAVFVPILGFLLLIYKIKKVSMLNMKKWIIVNVLTLFLITVVTFFLAIDSSLAPELLLVNSLKNTFGYIIVFLPIEILYHVFNRSKNLLPVFDRIMITGLVGTAAIYFYMQVLNINLEMIGKILHEVEGIDKKNMLYIISNIKNNIFYLIYTYIGFIIYMTYYSFGKKSYSYWRISYQWLILYMISFYLIKFGHVKNLYISNLMLIIKISFVVYGMKILYNLIRTKIKSNLICHILAALICFNFQNITFIIAGLLSFEAMKITIIRKNGGK